MSEPERRMQPGRGHLPDLCGKALVILLAAAILLSPAVILTFPPGVSLAQDQQDQADQDAPEAAGGQVIAEGTAEIPRGQVAWTLRRLDVPGGEGMTVDSFPLGFVLADSGTIELRNASGEVLATIAEGQAAFLPHGEAGSLISAQQDAASVYEVAIFSQRESNAGEAATAESEDDIVGTSFRAPRGDAFELTLTQETLDRDESATVPVSASETPSLFLQVAGTTRLEAAGDQVVELGAGQSALLAGEVTAFGASDDPASFVVAAIGEETTAAADARPQRERRADRQRARDGGAQADTAPRERRQKRERRPRRERTGGRQGGQAAQQGAGGPAGGAPVTGGTGGGGAPAGDVPAATPGLEPSPEATAPSMASPSPEATLPADAAMPGDGTPTPEPTVPTEAIIPTEAVAPEETVVTEVPAEETPPAAEPTVPVEVTVAAEESIAAESAPEAEAAAGEETLPAEPAPAEVPTEVPAADPAADSTTGG